MAAAPKNLPPESRIRGSLRGLRSATVELREAWTRDAAIISVDRRGIDVTSDASFRGLNWALEAVALVTGTEEDDARAQQAKTMLARLYPAGLAFTQEPFNAQWAHADRFVKMIDEDTEAELAELVGPSFVAFIHRAHAAYGRALSITQPNDAGATGVREPLRQLQLSVQQYVFTLFAEHPPHDPKNEALLSRALAPIDAFRAAQARSSQPTAPDAPAPAPTPVGPPIEPVPDVE